VETWQTWQIWLLAGCLGVLVGVIIMITGLAMDWARERRWNKELRDDEELCGSCLTLTGKEVHKSECIYRSED